jgi:hypothetical protein
VNALVVTALAFLGVVESPDELQLTACVKQGGEYVVTLKGDLRLVREFLDPRVSIEENARQAVLHEVKYVWG